MGARGCGCCCDIAPLLVQSGGATSGKGEETKIDADFVAHRAIILFVSVVAIFMRSDFRAPSGSSTPMRMGAAAVNECSGECNHWQRVPSSAVHANNSNNSQVTSSSNKMVSERRQPRFPTSLSANIKCQMI